MPRRNLSGQVVVITGAATGVGRATARAFGAEGAKVALIARGQEALDHAAVEIRERGGEAMVLPLDVADARAVNAAADQVADRWGHIDLWVNDAMVSVFAEVAETSDDEYRRVTEVTYLGYVFGTRAALRHMMARDKGHIIQIGSALAYRSIPLQSAYCAAKAAIRGFTDSLRCELIHARSAIKISLIDLPAVNTPQFAQVRSRLPNKPQPVPPIFQPELIANAVLRVARHPTRTLRIGGSTLAAINGQKFIPGLLDWYLARTGRSEQQTNEPADPDRKDNLYSPLPGDPGARGAFSHRAKSRSLALWLRLNRMPVAASTLTGLIALAVWRNSRPSAEKTPLILGRFSDAARNWSRRGRGVRNANLLNGPRRGPLSQPRSGAGRGTG